MANGNKKAILLVGHSDWGKSGTLNNPAFAGRNLHIDINDNRVVIIKRSNDDQLYKIIQAINKYINEQFIILAFCPNFDGKHFTVEVLELLKEKGYEIFSFVLKYKYKYNNLEETVKDDEIDKLKQYSKIEIYSEKNKEADVRAAEFKKYLERIIPPKQQGNAG